MKLILLPFLLLASAQALAEPSQLTIINTTPYPISFSFCNTFKIKKPIAAGETLQISGLENSERCYDRRSGRYLLTTESMPSIYADTHHLRTGCGPSVDYRYLAEVVPEDSHFTYFVTYQPANGYLCLR